MSTDRTSGEALDLLGRIRNSTQSPEEQRLLDFTFDAILFIRGTGQTQAFEEYRQYLDSNDPPPVVARFDTREEAEAWLEKHPRPPHLAHILIADAYHCVAYDREANIRRLPATPTLENYLARLRRAEPPVATASFPTRAEAEAWFKAQTAPAKRAWVKIADELYLAVYHPHLDHRALYPLSLAAEDDGDDEAPPPEPSPKSEG